MGYVIGAILGLALGLGLALFITVTLVKKSNDVGDSTGSLKDFGYLNVLISENDLHSARPSDRGRYILEEHRQKKMSEAEQEA